ncbi:Rz-like lysis system protein LysB [Brenneria goodwinii]|uniref:Rz-like lysis system protein LysB n=1 Tax=Brenneria tiliae TaxID=2914984 RepID=A0ABT0MWT5_9GAMM|nr:Rz-like lysis system protein LysB [Brenneria tiliae]MCL2894303.1 Rz-like lysis system protein LysB [Brenneria tiliae]
MSKALMQIIAIMAAWLLVMLAVTKWQLSNAKEALDQQGVTLSQQKDALLAQNAAIGTLQENARRDELAQVELRTKLSQAGQLAASRDKKITRLLNENEALRRWYGTALPDAIKQLHRRPAFASADGYLRWLSESDELPDPGRQSANQR